MTRKQSFAVLAIAVIAVGAAALLARKAGPTGDGAHPPPAASAATGSSAESGSAPVAASLSLEVPVKPDDIARSAESRRKLIQTIVASGPAHGPWAEGAPKVFAQIEGSVPDPLTSKIEVKAVNCYRKACLADVVYADIGAFEATNGIFLAAEPFAKWPGGKGRSAVDVTRSGAVQVTWMLMNPDETL